MPFSSKLKADYVELINGELDSIIIVCSEEFELIAQELQNLLTPRTILSTLKGFFSSALEKKPVLSKATQEQLAYVRYCLNTPQDFVKLEKDYAEYQEILKERIAAKIIELRTLSVNEKAAYIEFQKEKHPGFEKSIFAQ